MYVSVSSLLICLEVVIKSSLKEQYCFNTEMLTVNWV